MLAVVVTGVLLGHKAYQLQSAPSRIFERTNWETIRFLLENAVFLLIGLQVRAILDDVEDSPLGTGRITLATVAVFLAVLLIRPIGVFATTYLRPIQRRRDPEAAPRAVAVPRGGVVGRHAGCGDAGRRVRRCPRRRPTETCWC